MGVTWCATASELQGRACACPRRCSRGRFHLPAGRCPCDRQTAFASFDLRCSRSPPRPPGRERRSAPVPGSALALGRAVPRRARACGRRRSDDAKRFYFGAVNGGVWRDRRCRPHLAADLRRRQRRLDRRDRGRAFGAEVDLRRHRRSRHALRHRPGHRHVPLDRRRRDMDARSGSPTRSRSARSWSTRAIPNVLLVAALGHPYGPNAERGVFRSTDGGSALDQDAVQGREHRRDRPRVRARAIPNVVYAALWQTRRPPWNAYPPSNGPGSGLYKSSDGGRTLASI